MKAPLWQESNPTIEYTPPTQRVLVLQRVGRGFLLKQQQPPWACHWGGNEGGPWTLNCCHC
jgi:hypothetical protein